MFDRILRPVPRRRVDSLASFFRCSLVPLCRRRWFPSRAFALEDTNLQVEGKRAFVYLSERRRDDKCCRLGLLLPSWQLRQSSNVGSGGALSFKMLNSPRSSVGENRKEGPLGQFTASNARNSETRRRTLLRSQSRILVIAFQCEALVESACFEVRFLWKVSAATHVCTGHSRSRWFAPLFSSKGGGCRRSVLVVACCCASPGMTRSEGATTKSGRSQPLACLPAPFPRQCAPFV